MSRWPSWLQGVLTVVVMLVSIGVTNGVAEALPSRWAVVWWAGVVVAALGFIMWVRRQAGHQVGGRDQFTLFRKALRTGEVPPDADRRQWRAMIDEQREKRAAQWWFYGLLALFIAAINVYGALTSDLSAPARATILVFAVNIAVGCWVGLPALIVRRQNRRLDALREELDDPSPA